MAGGRPSIYNKELAEEICEQIATTNKGIATILKEKEEYPSESSFYGWLNSGNKEFLELYARAKERQADRLVTEILSISDETENDTTTTEDGREIPNNEWMSRSRLRVDSRKWLASKLLPKKYGDKLDITSDGLPLKPIIINWSDDKPTGSDHNTPDTQTEGSQAAT